jgi:hypothetical protein
MSHQTGTGPSRVFAVDWSGDKRGGARKIWLCEVAQGRVSRLEHGRKRDELAEHLVEEAERDPAFVVGFDFAFSFPESFSRGHGANRIEDVWELVEAQGERWLEQCKPPFWGKPGRKKPKPAGETQRRTEIEVTSELGSKPFSIFQIGGAGAVGVGSIRGMRIVRRLRQAGFAVWPFDEPRLPLVVEIWPRIFYGRLKKSRREERASYLRRHWRGVEPWAKAAARGSDDAFDALVSGLCMDQHREEFARLRRTQDPTALLEGAIWRPAAS